jgi:hypothetical protein
MLHFDVNSLLKSLKIPSITLYKNNNAKSHFMGNLKKDDKSSDEQNAVMKIYADDTPTILYLNTDTGIANFKILMEEVLYKLIKRSNTSKFNKYILLSSVKTPYGTFGKQIIPKFPMSDLNNPFNASKFQEVLFHFHQIDRVIENENKVKNSAGQIVP